VSFGIFRRVVDSQGLQRVCLLLFTGLCSGAGIWSTHFMAMLAYDPGLPTAYEPVLSALSLVMALAALTLGFTLASRPIGYWPAIGGAVAGFGVAVMHYVGMTALLVPGAITWDMTPVIVSIAVGAALSACAMTVFHRQSGARGVYISGALLALAICGLHFTGMGAVTLVPDPTVTVSTHRLDTTTMAFSVAAVALLIALSSVTATALIESNRRRERERELGLHNLRFDTALRHMPHGLCMFDAEQRLVVCNQRYSELYRLPSTLLQTGTPHATIIAHRVREGILKSDRTDAAVEQKLSALRQLPSDISSSRIDELSDGRVVRVTRQPMVGGGWVAIHEDVTEQRRAEAKIAHMALHDALTGLPNRSLLNERIEHALTLTKRGDIIAVHILDLDHFKHINDTLGHGVGDKLLQMVSERLQAAVRETDTIARMGGDEFAIVQVSLDQLADATTLAQRVIAALAQPFLIDGHQVVTGTSVGIGIAPFDGSSASQLLKNSDLALYRAKADGRGMFRFFEAGMDARMQERRELEKDLRQAVASGEFELHFQPIAASDSGQIKSFEALLRWQHSSRGWVPPNTFIPLAEETNLIVPIGEWVIRQACTVAARWPAKIGIAVNLSAVQLRGTSLLSTVVSALAASGLAPDRLELEITESMLIENGEKALAVLYALRELGVRISMDDFGTGYSSLSHLQRFPFDKIKIDRSFVSTMVDNPSSLSIVRAVAALACSLGAIATAEGVETQEQLEAIRLQGCSEMQGFLLSRPVPAAEVEERFLNRCAEPETIAVEAA
jgi:diguanylate cyclase (GGDEF)-like protein